MGVYFLEKCQTKYTEQDKFRKLPCFSEIIARRQLQYCQESRTNSLRILPTEAMLWDNSLWMGKPLRSPRGPQSRLFLHFLSDGFPGKYGCVKYTEAELSLLLKRALRGPDH